MSYAQLPQSRPVPQTQRGAGAEINVQGPQSARRENRFSVRSVLRG